ERFRFERPIGMSGHLVVGRHFLAVKHEFRFRAAMAADGAGLAAGRGLLATAPRRGGLEDQKIDEFRALPGTRRDGVRHEGKARFRDLIRAGKRKIRGTGFATAPEKKKTQQSARQAGSPSLHRIASV